MRFLKFFILFSFLAINSLVAIAHHYIPTIYANIESDVIVPNVFTPNSDGSNDLFIVSHNGIQSLTMKIYNRWGSEVYNFTGINSGWDGRTFTGKECPEGTYFYVLTYVSPEGNTFELTGSTSLFR